MPFTFRPMTEADVWQILTWHYEPPYDIYNLGSADVDSEVKLLLDPQNQYHAITDGHGNVVAYCCFGLDAQVPGGDYREAALDIGLGVRPDLTGQGHGHKYVDAVIGFAQETFRPAALRVSVASFNCRAQCVWETAGFRPRSTFAREPDGMLFVLLTRQP
jgi:ribosomal-protein-alanine N-acetyltransferase